MEKKFDLIVIGTGPAGVSAAVYAARYKLKTLLVGELMGGTITEAHKICNFITYSEISGAEFAEKLREQIKSLEITYLPSKVRKIEKGKEFKVIIDDEIYYSKKVIIATGNEKRKLGIKNEINFVGKGISYCATCDAAFFREKIVGVIGGSNSALTTALLLTEFAEKVYLIYRGEKFTKADPAWIEQVEKNKKIATLFNTNVIELIGENFLEKAKLNNGKIINLSGLFIEIGSVPQTELTKELGIELENGFVKVDKEQKTNVNGLFAAGDVTNNPLKQIVTAAGEGAIAANQAFREIQNEE